MKKIALAAILFTGCLQNGIAQTENNSTAGAKEKSTEMYIGVQLNALIRQVFNFNNTSANTNTNPYLLNYSINSRKSGLGLRFGVGYNYNSSTTNDGITKTEINLNDLQLRLGGEKVFKLSKKWVTGAGVDIVYNNNDDHTINTVNSGSIGGGQKTDTKTTIATYGGGPQGWLRYHISEKVLIGTEASFYFVAGTEERSVTVTNGFPNPTNQKPVSNDVSHGVFNSPIAFFIMVKF